MPEPVRVSMYNVGFGDCFLVRLPTPGGEKKMLIDCGSIKQGVAGGTDAVVAQLIEDVTENGQAHIDVVAVTHRHRDHVSGFGEPAWQNVQVDEVWLPWTEDPEDPIARSILQQMAGFAAALEHERDRPHAAPLEPAEHELITHVLDNTLGLTNEKAMDVVHRGFRQPRNKPRFLHRQTEPLDTPSLPGVTVHVLGPSKRTEVIREMNPPSEQSFLRMAAPGFVTDPDDELPFEPDQMPPMLLAPHITDFLQAFSNESAIFGAVALESAVNNTSLMLVLEVGEAVLLFPGDSQWGSWDVNLRDPLRKSLLERTNFYKVGHHGSHNSTPVDFVQKFLNKAVTAGTGVWAATSVVPHGSFDDIPRAPLLAKLATKIADPKRVVRSDQAPTKAESPKGLSVVRKRQKVVRVDFEVPTG